MRSLKTNWATLLGFYSVVYLVILIITVVGYPLGQTVFKPMVSLLFPLATDLSLGKTMVVVSVMFWVMVLGVAWMQRSKS